MPKRAFRAQNAHFVKVSYNHQRQTTMPVARELLIRYDRVVASGSNRRSVKMNSAPSASGDPMRIAILGRDPHIERLAQAAASAGHRLIMVGPDAGPPAEGIGVVSQRVPDWMHLVDPEAADAVAVGRADAEQGSLRAEQLRRLAQARVPLLVVHPAVLNADLYYELDMIRQETQGVLMAYVPGQNAPAVQALADWIRECHQRGHALHTVRVERALATVDRASVLGQLSRDLVVTSRLLGTANTLLALVPTPQSYAGLTVQWQSAAGPGVKWSLAPERALPHGLLAVEASHESVELVMADDASQWQFSPVGASNPAGRPSSYDDAAAAIEQLEACLVSPSLSAPFTLAARCVETCELVDKSLAKGRRIDVGFDNVSESSTFKGIATATGCGLLVVALVGVLVVGLADAVGLRLVRFWPLALLALLVVFLLLQTATKLLIDRKI